MMKNRDLFSELSFALVEAQQHLEDKQTFNEHLVDAESGVIPARKTSTTNESSTKVVGMSDEYDFSKVRSRNNPFDTKSKKARLKVK